MSGRMILLAVEALAFLALLGRYVDEQGEEWDWPTNPPDDEKEDQDDTPGDTSGR